MKDTCDRCGLAITDPYTCVFNSGHAVRHDPVEECITHLREALFHKDDEITRLKTERDDARERARRATHAHETATAQRDHAVDVIKTVLTEDYDTNETDAVTVVVSRETYERALNEC